MPISQNQDEKPDFIIRTLNNILNNPIITLIILIVLLASLIFSIISHNPFNIVKNNKKILTSILFLIILILSSLYVFVINFKMDNNSDNDNDFKNYSDSFYNFKKNEFEEKKVFNWFTNNTKGTSYLHSGLLEYLLNLFILILTVGLIVGSIFGSYWLLNNINSSYKIFKNVLFITGVIVALGIIYRMYETNAIYSEINVDNKLEESVIKNQFFNLFKNIIFYIPCLFLDFIKNLEYQYSITTDPIWILLIIEVIIVALYLLFPYISSLILHDGSTILKDPIYTNNLTNLGSFQNLSHYSKVNFNYNYGISLKLYINPQPYNTSPAYGKFTSLFNYANKPNILYNSKKNTLKIVCQDSKNNLETIFESKNIKLQKWMHFVINYEGGRMDIFLDNNLICSKSGIAPYMKLDNVTAGEKNGINGGIKDVIYFQNPIKKTNLLLFN